MQRSGYRLFFFNYQDSSPFFDELCSLCQQDGSRLDPGMSSLLPSSVSSELNVYACSSMFLRQARSLAQQLVVVYPSVLNLV